MNTGIDKKRVSVDDIKIPDNLRSKRGCIQLSEMDMQDEHIRYILSK